jgi:hypothetical protein
MKPGRVPGFSTTALTTKGSERLAIAVSRWITS